MDELSVDIQQGDPVRFLTDHVGLPNLVKQCLPSHAGSSMPDGLAIWHATEKEKHYTYVR
jgi:hypothetical protein